MPNEFLIITLTGRVPVKITKDEWPVLASATEVDDHGTEIGNPPNREDGWRLMVRQHADGRAIVYGIYWFKSLFRKERDVEVRGGEILDFGADTPAAITRVAAQMSERVNATGRPGDRFLEMGERCIAGLPAETV